MNLLTLFKPTLQQTRIAEKQLKIEQLATKFVDVTNALKTDLANEIDSIKILLKLKSRDHAKNLLRFDTKFRNHPFPTAPEQMNNTTESSCGGDELNKLRTANDVGKLVCGVLIDSAPQAWQNMVTKIEPLAKQLVDGINVLVQELLQFVEMQQKSNAETCNKTITLLQVFFFFFLVTETHFLW